LKAPFFVRLGAAQKGEGAYTEYVTEVFEHATQPSDKKQVHVNAGFFLLG